MALFYLNTLINLKENNTQLGFDATKFTSSFRSARFLLDNYNIRIRRDRDGMEERLIGQRGVIPRCIIIGVIRTSMIEFFLRKLCTAFSFDLGMKKNKKG